MKAIHEIFLVVAICACSVGVQADVFEMPDGLTSLETVTVGNPGNDGELSGECVPGGRGPCRICGAVDYVYNIGKFEVTAGQYREFLNAVAATDTYGLYDPRMNSDSWGCQITQNGPNGSHTYDFSGGTVEDPNSTAADWVNRPVNYVSWGDAARFCNWLHNGQPTGAQGLNTTEDGSYYLNGAMTNAELMAIDRESKDATWVIPSEDEWYKAAYYDTRLESEGGPPGDDHYWLYPTVNDIDPNNDLIDPDPGNDATFYDSEIPDQPASYTIGSPYYRTEGGAHENSDSPYGTFDQGANVWEWNEAIMVSIHGGWIRGQRGGSFYQLVDDLTASTRANHWDLDPTNALPHAGFRVAEVSDIFATGDLNCDGSLDSLDIDPFVLALSDQDGYAIVYPDCDVWLADCNGDGWINSLDIDCFVSILSGG